MQAESFSIMVLLLYYGPIILFNLAYKQKNNSFVYRPFRFSNNIRKPKWFLFSTAVLLPIAKAATKQESTF